MPACQPSPFSHSCPRSWLSHALFFCLSVRPSVHPSICLSLRPAHRPFPFSHPLHTSPPHMPFSHTLLTHSVRSHLPVPVHTPSVPVHTPYMFQFTPPLSSPCPTFFPSLPFSLVDIWCVLNLTRRRQTAFDPHRPPSEKFGHVNSAPNQKGHTVHSLYSAPDNPITKKQQIVLCSWWQTILVPLQNLHSSVSFFPDESWPLKDHRPGTPAGSTAGGTSNMSPPSATFPLFKMDVPNMHS